MPPLFKTSKPHVQVPDSPVSLFRDLKRSSELKYLWDHQAKILERFHSEFLKKRDVAIESPTGSGKTLVGLLIADYVRRAFSHRVAVLCPTKQLCAQVAKQAEKYGTSTVLLIEKQKDYDPNAFLRYQRAEATVITTYSAIFNTSPKIDSPQTIICDDAHSGEGFIASMWTLRITLADHPDLFKALLTALSPCLTENVRFLIDTDPNTREGHTVDMISPLLWESLQKEIVAAIDGQISAYRQPGYAWSLLKSKLMACNLYCSGQSFEFRPILPPTQSHAPFKNAERRIYMSATLGEDGDLERSFGIEKIDRIPIPQGTEKYATGRRLILFPGLASNFTEHDPLANIIRLAGRGLILTPKTSVQKKLAKFVTDNRINVLTSAESEAEIEKFRTSSTPVALVLANRYDGIDFPGSDCRCEVLFGFPMGACMQENFLISRLQASSIVRDRIRTRVTQAMGRCTRYESDYSIVLIYEPEVIKWFGTKENITGMHPELQAEINFGFTNSESIDGAQFETLCDAFLKRSSDWDIAEEDIKTRRDATSKLADPEAATLQKSVSEEIKFVYDLWAGRYAEAYGRADAVLGILSGGEGIKPYRCFWEHQAAVSAYLAWRQAKTDRFKTAVIERLNNAAKNSLGLSSLAAISAKLSGQVGNADTANLPHLEWFEVVEELLTDLGLTGAKFSKQLELHRVCITSKSAKQFHQGLEFLGKMLGAKTHQWNGSGTPDGFWRFGFWKAYVFEAKTNEIPTEPVSLSSVRQAGTHATNVRSDGLVPPNTPVHTVLVSPRTTIRKDAVIHAHDIKYLAQETLIRWFDAAAEALTELRVAYPSESEHNRAECAAGFYRQKKVFFHEIDTALIGKSLGSLPVPEPDK